MTLVSPVVTPDLSDSRRFAAADFLIFKWFMPVLLRRILPLPVISNRFAAVLFVFSFGTYQYLVIVLLQRSYAIYAISPR